MIACIVLCHHQDPEPMLKATEAYGDYRVLVIDRSPEIASQDWPNVIRNEVGQGFLAGRMRQLGLDTALNLWPNLDGVVWYDGDRLPNKPILATNRDVILYRAEVDPRGDLVENITEDCKHPYSPFYTCGFYLSRKALYALDCNIYDPDFDGQWGFEDLYLGDRVVDKGFKVSFPKDLVVSGVIQEPLWLGLQTPLADPRYVNWYKRLEKRKSLKGVISMEQAVAREKARVAMLPERDMVNLLQMIEMLPFKQAHPMMEILNRVQVLEVNHMPDGSVVGAEEKNQSQSQKQRRRQSKS